MYRLGSGSGVKRNVVYATYFGTEMLDPAEPARDYEERRTRCYELACQALVWGGAPAGSLLIHGSMHGDLPGQVRIGHAWLELPGGAIWEPILGDVFATWADWQMWSNAISEHTYTLRQAQQMITQHETYGPWRPTKYR